MGTIIVSNRMSTSVSRTDAGFTYTPSVGGLATGLSSFHGEGNGLWVGWSGLPADTLTETQRDEISTVLRHRYSSVTVDLSTDDLERFYYGFCNDIVWPLFHYFPTYVTYDESLWDSYVDVNQRYFERVKELVRPDDVVWIHDYQLMLLPQLVKAYEPNARVGFFLHIPFPSYELFRLLPWREEILRGLLGADLVGFHTYDYARHFLSSTRRLLGYDHDLATVRYENRMVKVDVFPMGIDFAKFSGSHADPKVRSEIETIRADRPAPKIILSVDRLDYTKGIPQRLRAYERFLERHEEYRGRVTMIMIVSPSRTAVTHYQELKREVDELVSTINGRFSLISWTPVHYFYRTFPFEQLAALYSESDVLLVTALRDGMNLVAKEFIAAKRDRPGGIVLSETAGVARELSEAIVVNPNSVDDIANGLAEALEMDPQEQVARNLRMQERLERYDVHYWARDFLSKLDATVAYQRTLLGRRLQGEARSSLLRAYRATARRLILIDYDGTLVPPMDRPERASPDPTLLTLIETLAGDPSNQIVIQSSRGRDFLGHHLGTLRVGLIASHGVWARRAGGEWEQLAPVESQWKEQLAEVMELHADRTPGSRFEEKEYGLAWHYRGSDPDLAFVRVAELRDALLSLTSNHNITLFEGNRALEVTSSLASKAQAAALWHDVDPPHDFILAIGDDPSDEALFASLPESAHTVRVGLGPTTATYFVENIAQVRALIGEFAAR